MKISNWTPSDYAAWGALALSIAYGLVSLISYLRGPEIEFTGPRMVELRCSHWDSKNDICKNTSRLTITGSSMTYTNTGGDAYHGSLEAETVSFIFDKKPIRLDWWYFANITNVGSRKTVAGRQLLPGGKTTRHETQFFPRWRPCEAADQNCDNGLSDSNFVNWSDLIAAVSDPSRFESLELTFNIEYLEAGSDRKYSSHKCVVYIPDKVRDDVAAASMSKRYITLPCI